MSQMENLLSSLNLKGAKESLGFRLQEAVEANLNYEDFLLLLLEDEYLYRRNKKSETLRKRAKFRNSVSLEDFEHSPKRGLTKTTIRHFASLQFMETNKNLLLYGSTGVGKTFFAQALGHHSCINGHETLFTSVNQLFEAWKASQAGGTTINFLKKHSKAKLLVLDDFGLRNYTHDEATLIYDILEERFQKGSVVVTSQVRPEGWKTLFEDPVIADAIIDRLVACAYKVEMKGGSYRKKYAPDELPKNN